MSPAVVLISRVRKNVVLWVNILALKVGPFLFHSTTLVLSQCTNFLPGLWLLCIFSSTDYRCTACSFSEYFTPKSSTTKVNLLVFCCISVVQGFCLRCGIHADLGVLPGSHVLSDLIGGVHTFPLLTLLRCIHCVIFM